MGEPRQDLSGLVAGRYRVERVVGEGGMARVYLARDERHASRVALKVLRPELVPHAGGERFVREIRITAQLQHPNILPVFDSGEADGQAFYVMPFVEGETLAQRIRREGPLPVEEALAVAAEVADALAYAHQRGFVHRDVKPSNIMLSHGHALLGDFGIARAIDAALADAITETGLSVGTVTYMSPEQALGDAVDGRTDVYSLGCVLYEMLAGTPPFTGSRQAVLARHMTDPVPSLSSVRPSVPETVEQAVVKAMAKAPGDRYPDAAELREVLRRQAVELSARQDPVPSRARPWAVGALAVAVLVAVVFGGIRLADGGGSAPALADDRVLMMPLHVSEGYAGPASTGEDVATLIISALDGAAALRWMDGTARMDPGERDGFRVPGLDASARLARDASAAYFVTGSVTPAGADLASVSLTLVETASSEPVRTVAADPVPAAEAWRGGLLAANRLLSELIEGAPDVSSAWLDREPGAIASFLRAEAAFRRIRIEEALARYHDALARDSMFAFAAIRGAQAASWGHRASEVTSMVEHALSLPLPSRYASFIEGYAAYLRGDAGAAVSALDRTVADDPDMAEAWTQIGEVYTHLLPAEGDPDSLALAAFEQARRLDPTASNIAFHVIEILLRRGETTAAGPLLDRLRVAEADSDFATKLEIMDRCVREGPDAVDWEARATETPFPTLTASKSLSVAAAQVACARSGYRAILSVDTSATDAAADGRRWASLIGLQSLLIATGRPEEAAAEIDAFVDRWGYGRTLMILDGTVIDELVPRAREAARSIRERDGPYREWASEYRLWVVGALEATHGDATEADRIADELARRAREAGSARSDLMARSVRAHVALARGDTADALLRLQELVPPVLSGDEVSWNEFAPLGLERLALARLHLAMGEPRAAIRVADVFDSQSPHVYVLFVAESLRLRLEAARRLPDQLLVNRYMRRIEALGN